MDPAAPLFAQLGAVEIGIAALAVLTLLSACRKWPELISGIRQGWREFKDEGEQLSAGFKERQTDLVAEALTHDNRTAEYLLPDEKPDNMKSNWIVWLAQGFGVGRIPVAPGTWGSLVGVGWALLLLSPGSLVFYLTGIVLSTLAAVLVCDRAERILGQHDPGSVVLDEIVAVPVALGGYVMLWWGQAGTMPEVAALAGLWPVLAAAFALFRLFDVWKPWPIRALQRLPGGWGVVADDLAAGLVSAVVLWLGCHAVFVYGLVRG